jgi:hypothetical protein
VLAPLTFVVFLVYLLVGLGVGIIFVFVFNDGLVFVFSHVLVSIKLIGRENYIRSFVFSFNDFYVVVTVLYCGCVLAVFYRDSGTPFEYRRSTSKWYGNMGFY